MKSFLSRDSARAIPGERMGVSCSPSADCLSLPTKLALMANLAKKRRRKIFVVSRKTSLPVAFHGGILPVWRTNCSRKVNRPCDCLNFCLCFSKIFCSINQFNCSILELSSQSYAVALMWGSLVTGDEFTFTPCDSGSLHGRFQ